VLTAILFVGLNLMGQHIWAAARFQGPAPGSLPVEITGLQFQWYFRYPGPDGKFGSTRADLEDPSTGNALGIDDTDPAGKDDIITSTLVIPVNRELDVTLRSQDVIHDFFVADFRFKQDAVPGLNIHMHFTPTKIGDYETDCAELCGSGHYKMRAGVKVVSDEDYAAFLKSPQEWLNSHPWVSPENDATHVAEVR
jgi:cytochrome c oxidase subunit 2